MKKSVICLFILIVFTGLYAQQIIENPERPISQNAGRVLELKEKIRIKDKPGVFYFKNPVNIKAAPDGSIFVLDEEQFLKNNRYYEKNVRTKPYKEKSSY